jgi:hypothetical protein
METGIPGPSGLSDRGAGAEPRSAVAGLTPTPLQILERGAQSLGRCPQNVLVSLPLGEG